ncbi:MAG TPA: apolipoprotein N-acyltransferase [Thermoanaerobaculia bacterium]|nr:apolipoprotein N-acyltransferase [Thermoanaerobaculia bacterium]
MGHRIGVLLLAAGGGAVWGLCFGRETLPLASWAALAPLLLLLGHRRAPLLGWLHGTLFWAVSISWITPTLETYGGLPRPLALALTAGLCAFLGLYHLAFAWLGRPLWRRGGALPLAALPALWVALEWLRTYAVSGFPWNLAGYAWIDVPGALPLAAWIGVFGLSYLLVLANTGVARAVARGRWAPAAVPLLLPLLLLPLAGRWSRSWSADAGELSALSGAGPVARPVRILQPNIPNLVAFDRLAVERNYRKVLAHSNAACDPGSLLVWPESAAWPFSYARDPHLTRDLAALARRGCTVLFNSVHEEGESYYNSVFLVAEGRPLVRYDKRHLVPFGEYVPLQGVFTFMDSLARNAGDFRAAERLVLLPWAGERLGVAICFEVIFPAEVAELARAGATVLVTVTNDAWYGDTFAPWQHLRMARFRAAETRRPMLRAAITGVSALIAPDGSVRAQLGVYDEGVIRGTVSGRRGVTPFARRPWVVPAACTLLAVGALVAARRRRLPVLPAREDIGREAEGVGAPGGDDHPHPADLG